MLMKIVFIISHSIRLESSVNNFVILAQLYINLAITYFHFTDKISFASDACNMAIFILDKLLETNPKCKEFLQLKEKATRLLDQINEKTRTLFKYPSSPITTSDLGLFSDSNESVDGEINMEDRMNITPRGDRI